MPVSCYLFSNNGVVLIALFNVSLESLSRFVFSSVEASRLVLQARTILLSLLWKLVQFSQCVEEVARNTLFISAH